METFPKGLFYILILGFYYMADTSKIRVIAFDIGGVLTKTNFKEFYTKLDRLAKECNTDPELFKNLRKKYSNESMVGKVTYGKFKKKILGALNVKNKRAFIDKWEDFLYSAMNINNELSAIIFKLKKNHILVSFSNVTPMFHSIRHKKGVYSHFKMNLLSHQTGLKKPSIKFYRLLIKKMKVKPSEMVFIDDNRDNLIPARKLGMKTILYTDNKRFVKDLNKFGINV